MLDWHDSHRLVLIADVDTQCAGRGVLGRAAAVAEAAVEGPQARREACIATKLVEPPIDGSRRL